MQGREKRNGTEQKFIRRLTLEARAMSKDLDFWKNLYKLVTRWSGGGEQHRRVFDLEPDLNLGEPGALLGLNQVGGGDRRPQPGQEEAVTHQPGRQHRARRPERVGSRQDSCPRPQRLHQSNVNRTSLFQPQRLKASFDQEYPISRPLTKTIFTHITADNRPFLVNKFCPALQTCSYILMGTIILAGKGKAVEFSFPNHGREEEWNSESQKKYNW